MGIDGTESLDGMAGLDVNGTVDGTVDPGVEGTIDGTAGFDVGRHTRRPSCAAVSVAPSFC